MRSIRLKTTCTGNNVNTTLAHPGAPLGDIRQASVQIRQVNNIPDDIQAHEVIRLFNGTADMTRRMEFDYSELGIGRILMD